jgi:hypothetical protein
VPHVTVRKAYIRYREDLPESVNNFAALDGFRQLGVETAPFYGFGDIEELTDLGPEVMVVGFVGDVWNALRKMGRPLPKPMDYPEELRPWLGREVSRSTLGDVRRKLDPFFFKPVEEKLFTGFVWRSAMGDQIRVASLPDETEVWVSDEVEFVSEYRCFVQDDELVGVRHYKGDAFVAPKKALVLEAIQAFQSGPRAYSLDFGVTDSGETKLVEVNDAYALGHYGLPSITYARLIDARWEELTR